MNINNPQQEILEAIVRDDYRGDLKDINYSDFAFDIADKQQSSDDDEEINDDLDVESSDEFNEVHLKVPNPTQIHENPKILNKIREDETLNAHAKLVGDVQSLMSILEQEEIPIPSNFKKLANNPNINTMKLRELKVSLNDLYENRLTANYFTDWIIQLSVMASTFFDGETMIPFLNFKPNLTGYSTRIKAQTNSLNKENMQIARKINKKIGGSATTLFKWSSILLLPALITLGQNHGNKKLADYDKHNDLDSENEMESSYESDDEEDEEEEEN